VDVAKKQLGKKYYAMLEIVVTVAVGLNGVWLIEGILH